MARTTPGMSKSGLLAKYIAFVDCIAGRETEGPPVITREHLQGLQVKARARVADEEHKQLRENVKREVDRFEQKCLTNAGSNDGSTTSTEDMLWLFHKSALTSAHDLREMVEKELAPRMSGVELSVTSSKHNPECINMHAFWG